MLEAAKSRVGRYVKSLGAAILKGAELAQLQQELAISRLVPAGVTDMPRDVDKASKSSTVDFPVNTVLRTHNGAFVGRNDLLARMADKINKGRQPETPLDVASTPSGRAASGDLSSDSGSHKTQASSGKSQPKNSPIICVLHGLGGVGKTQVAAEYYYEHRGEYDATFWMEAEHDWTLSSSFARIADELELLERKTTDDGGHEVQNKAIEESRKWLQTTGKSVMLSFNE